jgi:hypothetical protein
MPHADANEVRSLPVVVCIAAELLQIGRSPNVSKWQMEAALQASISL